VGIQAEDKPVLGRREDRWLILPEEQPEDFPQSKQPVEYQTVYLSTEKAIQNSRTKKQQKETRQFFLS
jgi:hypothetical protein